MLHCLQLWTGANKEHFFQSEERGATLFSLIKMFAQFISRKSRIYYLNLGLFP